MRKVSPSACRDVAQSGSALEWGSRGRRFKSFHPDQHFKENDPKGINESWFPFLVFGEIPIIGTGWCVLEVPKAWPPNASGMGPADKKTGEKGRIFTILWGWDNHILTTGPWRKRPKRDKRKKYRILPYRTFHFGSVMEKALSWHMVVLSRQYTENICFFSIFPLEGSMAGGFYWLSLWNFKR